MKRDDHLSLQMARASLDHACKLLDHPVGRALFDARAQIELARDAIAEVLGEPRAPVLDDDAA